MFTINDNNKLNVYTYFYKRKYIKTLACQFCVLFVLIMKAREKKKKKKIGLD